MPWTEYCIQLHSDERLIPIQVLSDTRVDAFGIYLTIRTSLRERILTGWK